MKSSPMNELSAVVLGATGLVGGHLVDLLGSAKHVNAVHTLTRRTSYQAHRKISNVVVNFEKLDQHRSAFHADVLFLCLGTTHSQAGSYAAQRRVDFDYQYQAASLGLEQGVKHLVLVSSSGANARSLSPYLRMKGELEAAVIELDFDHTSIIRPSLLLGERARRRWAEGIAATVMPTLCQLPILRRYRPIHGEQVARKLVELSVAPSQKLEVIELDQVFPDTTECETLNGSPKT